MSEKYKCLVTMSDGKKRIRTIKRECIGKKIQDNILKIFGESKVKRIEVLLWNDYTGKFYKSLTYDSKLEMLRGKYLQVENKKGCGDYSNYGARTNGRFQRFYLGKSTGWIPCYITVWKSNSTGGGAFMESCYKKNTLKEV